MPRSKKLQREIDANHQSWALQRERYDRALQKAIVTNVGAACMSDTKWRKIFLALDGLDPRPKACCWKWVLSNTIKQTRFPEESDVGEVRIEDRGIGPFEYKEIEWIEIITGDSSQILEVLGHIGQFETEIVAQGVRLYGYR